MTRSARRARPSEQSRNPSGVTPTPLGELLYSHARLIRDELELAGRRMRGDTVRFRDRSTLLAPSRDLIAEIEAAGRGLGQAELLGAPEAAA